MGKDYTVDLFAGTHILADFFGCDGINESIVAEILERAVEICGAELLNIQTHALAQDRVIGVAILKESHISIHTNPDLKFIAVDAFVCGDLDPMPAIEYLRDALNPKNVCFQKVFRGGNF